VTDLSNPHDYYAFPAAGSGMVADWLADEERGDFETWRTRYQRLPWLDACRARGEYPVDADTVRLWERCRRKSTRAMRIGSMIEAKLFSPFDPDEWQHASEGANLYEIDEAKEESNAIASCCPTVQVLRDKVRRGEAMAQVAIVAFVEGVPCKGRIDLQWIAGGALVDGAALVETDVKIWTQWRTDRELDRLVRKHRAVIQRAHYGLIRQELYPGVELATELLVVNPKVPNELPIEREFVFKDEEIAAAEIEVRRALRGIGELLKEERKAAA